MDDSGRILTLTYSGMVGPGEMDRCFQRIKALASRLQPNFLLLSDMTNLEVMESSCAATLGAMMEFSSEAQVARICRIVPDQSKDIGLALISHFHLNPNVKVHVYSNLADAVSSMMPGR